MRKEIMPQLPDYFGFLLGFLLIWLIYTGFGAVKGVFIQTHQSAMVFSSKAKIATKESVVALQTQAKDMIKTNSVLVDEAKDKVEQLQLKLENSRARLAGPVETKKKKNWSSEQLKKANSFINDLIVTLGESIYGASEETVESSIEPISPKPSETTKRNDSLEWFQ